MKPLSRRDFLKLGGATAGGLALSASGGTPMQTNTPARLR
ncbi:MAG: twin-arginine translocation signal domain-containing protein [Chloroflexi bacterium]|nr:twin-arginine translocation signal domain-containing protein [Chloroflexota bacterium]